MSQFNCTTKRICICWFFATTNESLSNQCNTNYIITWNGVIVNCIAFGICTLLEMFTFYKSTLHENQLNYFPSSASNYQIAIIGRAIATCNNNNRSFQSKSRTSYFDGSAEITIKETKPHRQSVTGFCFLHACISVLWSVQCRISSLLSAGLSPNWIIAIFYEVVSC